MDSVLLADAISDQPVKLFFTITESADRSSGQISVSRPQARNRYSHPSQDFPTSHCRLDSSLMRGLSPLHPFSLWKFISVLASLNTDGNKTSLKTCRQSSVQISFMHTLYPSRPYHQLSFGIPEPDLNRK